ncbi:MAG: hypothetical protein ACRD4O_09550, partial [Bryobacteraceae bacterium]
MEFCTLKAGKPVAAAAGFALFLAGLLAAPLSAQQNPPQTGAAQQAQKPKAKNYKDRGEYDLYSKVVKTTDPQQRLQLLNTWKDKYPNSDFKEDRLKYFVATLAQLAQKDASQRPPLIETCETLLKLDPNDFYANYYVSLYGPQVPATPQLAGEVQTSANALLKLADTVFAPDKKKANMTDQQWTQAKNQVLAVGHN